MTNDTWLKLDQLYADLPVLRAEQAASASDIATAEDVLSCSFPDSYRKFLARYGAGIVGPFPVFGLRPVAMMGRDHWSVIDLTKEAREQGVPEIADWVVVSEDHAGNVVGFDRQGQIRIYDHDFGGEQLLSKDFEAYLEYCLTLE